MTTKAGSLVTLLALVALLVAACGSPTTTDATDQEGGITVVATTGILGDLVDAVLGDDGEVEVLMPAGADPHDFTASAAQASLLRSADLVVANGLGLESGMIDVLEAAEADGSNVLELAGRLDPLPFGAGSDHDHEEEEHEGEEHEGEHEEEHEGDDHGHTGDDPHFWLDPLRVADAVDLIAAALHEIEPNHEWEERADEYRSQIEELHAEIEATLEPIPAEHRKLVTNHDAFGYFADRYDFEVLATVIPGGSTMAEPSAAELGELVEILEHEDIRAVFADTSAPATLAEAAAAELGDTVEVYQLYTESLGTDDAVDDYQAMMLANAGIIAGALGD